MEMTLERKFEEAIVIGKLLFDRGKVTGSSANLSFLHEGILYITGSGTCFGLLKKEDFAAVDQEGTLLSQIQPSKELPMHRSLYEAKDQVHAIIHTHSFYSTAFSCFTEETGNDIMPAYTPYLRMKVGKIGMIPYAAPGSQTLFSLFQSHVGESDGFLLQNHGLIIGAATLKEAFYGVEELEESARIACFMKGMNPSQTSQAGFIL